MRPITVTFVLTGANAGRTMQLRRDDEVRFVNGRAKFTGPAETVQFVANRLAYSGAFLMGSPELETALESGLVTQEQINGNSHPQANADATRMAQLQGDVRSDGRGAGTQDAAGRDGNVEGPGSSIRDGLQDRDRLGATSAGKDERLVAAIRRLDPADDKLWTTDGRPLVDAVASIYGQGVGRAQIEAAIPGFTRDVAAL